jgi:hypothetical protein
VVDYIPGSVYEVLWNLSNCCIVIVLMIIRVFFISDFLNLYVVRRVWIAGLCVVPLAPVVITMSGATFQPFHLDVID